MAFTPRLVLVLVLVAARVVGQTNSSQASAAAPMGQTNSAAASVAAITPTAVLRIAVISTPDTADLAALVVTELSSNPKLTVINRDDLAKAGDDVKLRQLAGGDSISLGKILGANGLLFISKDADAIHLRFTAVGLGYALFDDQVDPAADLPGLAHTVAQRVADYAPKLALDPGTAIAISVLNLRADYDTAESAALERKLTFLLESRLSALPGYVVLERRHAWFVGREHDLSPAPKPILPGSYVVDGNITPPLPGDTEVVVHLRLRLPTGQQTLLEIHGPISDSSALVEQMAADIQKATGAAPVAGTWQPGQEAHEYLLEGIWGYQHREDETGLEALDSAELLGETASDLLAVRIPLLCRRVLATTDPDILYGNAPIPDDPKPEQKIADLERAMSDEASYEKEGGEGKLQVIDHLHSMDGRTGELHKMVDRTGSLLLAMLDRTNQSQANEVRSAIRSFAGYDPLHGKLPGDWEIAIDFADEWATSKDEEVAYYRGLMTTYPFADFGAWRLNFRLSPDNFCARFLPAPEDRRAAYFALFQDLSHDPVAAPLSLYFLAVQAPPDKKDAACLALYSYLWDQHEKLNAAGHLTYILKYAWTLEKSRGVKVADPKLIALLHFYLEHDNSFTGLEAQMWLPELFPPADAPSLLADLQGYEKRDVRAQHNHVYRDMETAFYDCFGGGPQAGPELPALEITRFWFPKNVPRRLILGMGAISPASDGLWLSGELDGDPATNTPPVGLLYHIGIDSSRTNYFVDPAAPIVAPHPYLQKVVPLPGALYILTVTEDQPPKTVVDHLDLASQQWDETEVPGADQLFSAAGQLYLSLKGLDFAHREGGLERYDGKTGNVTLLASSRRRPAQNQFDDRSDYRVENVFAGPDNKPCATIQFKNYFIKDTPGPWEFLTDAGLLTHAKTEDSRTLLYGPGSFKNAWDAAVLVDPTKPHPELWLGPVAPLPAWATTPIWPQSQAVALQSSDYGFHGGDLFALATQGRKSKKVELIWYQRGRAEPVQIPLAFKISDEAKTALMSVLSSDSNTLAMVAEPDKTPYVLMMTVLPQGVCFKGLVQGFWFLPFKDIQDYLKKNGAVASPAPSAPAGAGGASSTQSSHGGDTIDTGNPTSFE